MKKNRPSGVGKGFCSCGAPVLWVGTRSGRLLMLEPQPELEGCYAIIDNVAVLVRRKLDARPLYLLHSQRCPNGGLLMR